MRQDAAANREKVLDAATEVFAARGMQAEVKEIAERAGVGIGTIYRAFGRKEDLLEAIAREALGAVMTAYDAADSNGNALNALSDLLEQLYLSNQRYGWLLEGLLAGQISQEFLEEVESQHHEMRLERIFRRAMDQGTIRADLDPAVAAMMVAGSPQFLEILLETRSPHDLVQAVLRPFLAQPPEL